MSQSTQPSVTTLSLAFAAMAVKRHSAGAHDVAAPGLLELQLRPSHFIEPPSTDVAIDWQRLIHHARDEDLIVAPHDFISEFIERLDSFLAPQTVRFMHNSDERQGVINAGVVPPHPASRQEPGARLEVHESAYGVKPHAHEVRAR